MTALAIVAFLAAVAWLLALAHELDDTQPLLETTRVVLFETSFGPSWIARLILAAAAVVAALLNWPKAVALAAAGLLICEGWDGHAVAHGLRGSLTQAVHVLCAGVWIGGLFPFAAIVRAAWRGEKEGLALAAVWRFSHVAMTAVALILVTGLINVFLLEPGLILTGVYARVLAIKVLLFAAMFALATYNRFRLLPQMHGAGERPALKSLLTTTALEQTLAVFVLLAVSALGLMDPYMASM
jgi:putative copper resistance protein D